MQIYQSLVHRARIKQKSIAVLIDPDKVDHPKSLNRLINLAAEAYVDFFFVGGSLIAKNNLNQIIQLIKSDCRIPVVLFPGNNMQLDFSADAILFLSLISGRNPDLLIGQHVLAAPILKNSALEILPTGYILVSDEVRSSVSYMSNTMPIPSDKYSIATSTAMAGEMLGLKLMYLDAGSGASESISPKMVGLVKKSIDCPLIVGGGIRQAETAAGVLSAGADIIVMGNAIEKNPNLLIEVSEKIYDFNKTLDIH